VAPAGARDAAAPPGEVAPLAPVVLVAPTLGVWPIVGEAPVSMPVAEFWAGSVETASHPPMVLPLRPFVCTVFVPAASMPTGLRQFAEYQPFTPVTETVRGLLTGTAIGDHAVIGVAWSLVIALAAYAWAVHLYVHRQPR